MGGEVTEEVQKAYSQPMSGSGRVFRGEDYLADVIYSFQECRLNFEPLAEVDAWEVCALGFITVFSGDQNLWGRGRLSLHLEDGSCWGITLTKGDIAYGDYEAIMRQQ
jgi:hypothetical protein